MKVIAYARVSTDDQDQNPERQLITIRGYCKEHNHQILAEFTDYCTGDSDPFTRRWGKEIPDYFPSAIVVYSLDRLTRQYPGTVLMMIDKLRKEGTIIISVTEPIFNMESEFSSVFLFLLSWFNNYYLTQLKKNVKSGLERARAEGKHIGRPAFPFDVKVAYQLLYVEKKRITHVAEQLRVSSKALRRFKKGMENSASLVYKQVHSEEPGGFSDAR